MTDPMTAAPTTSAAEPDGPTPRTDEVHTLVMDSPVGQLRLTAEGDHIIAVSFLDDDPPVDADDGESVPILVEARRQLVAYFAGERDAFELPLAPKGTEFQRRVWDELRTIAYGSTASYGEIARRLGMGPRGSRAVGLANGSNPIAIIVPCHRVIGANGRLTGYGGGLRRKEFLLGLESARAAQGRLFE
jgi:methylated-DNA-[protein]-cysteine S-methyltransferase